MRLIKAAVASIATAVNSSIHLRGLAVAVVAAEAEVMRKVRGRRPDSRISVMSRSEAESGNGRIRVPGFAGIDALPDSASGPEIRPGLHGLRLKVPLKLHPLHCDGKFEFLLEFLPFFSQ